MQEKKLVFGYGSILNPKSMAKDVDPACFVGWAKLQGYGRIFNAPVDDSLAINIQEQEGSTIEGVLLSVDDTYFEALKKREKGYTPVDITEHIEGSPEGVVIAFIAPQKEYPDMHISRDYYELCKSAIPLSLQNAWESETVRNNPIQ